MGSYFARLEALERAIAPREQMLVIPIRCDADDDEKEAAFLAAAAAAGVRPEDVGLHIFVTSYADWEELPAGTAESELRTSQLLRALA